MKVMEDTPKVSKIWVRFKGLFNASNPFSEKIFFLKDVSKGGLSLGANFLSKTLVVSKEGVRGRRLRHINKGLKGWVKVPHRFKLEGLMRGFRPRRVKV